MEEHMTRISIIVLQALAVGMSAPSFAQSAKDDPTGRTDLGVDIRHAGGSTKKDHQAFYKALPTGNREKVEKVCLVAVGDTEKHNPAVITFCKNVFGD
jgi:hypothetical protein